jgi:hypothetical protein
VNSTISLGSAGLGLMPSLLLTSRCALGASNHGQGPVQVHRVRVDQPAAAVGVLDCLCIRDGKDGVISG